MWLIRAYLLEKKIDKWEVGVPKKVKIISYRKRKCDKDNFEGGLKLLIDALKYIGLIFDDSPKWLKLEAQQQIDRNFPRTEIFIENEN